MTASVTMRELRDGLEILLRYGDGDVATGHDVILAGPDGVAPEDMAGADVRRLKTLRWTWDEREESWKHCA